MKRVLYIDMDNTLVDFTARLAGIDQVIRERYRGREAEMPKRLILSHHKHLNAGDFLVDDRPTHNGADKFGGETIHFNSERFPDWKSVVGYLKERATVD